MQNANDLFTQHNCSEQFFRHFLPGIVYTEGIKAAADQLQCYWFLDVVASYQLERKLKDEPFQTWKLQRQDNDAFLVRATDGNDKTLCTQKIPYSDFPHDEFTVWFCDNSLILLPSEY